ncbi:MAG: 4Fe-4S binding protein [Acidimicrobiales bacterium]
MTVAVDDRCTACGACLATCPTGALLPAPGRPLVVDRRCTGCLECVEICPRGAIAEVPSRLPGAPPRRRRPGADG